MEGDLSLLSNLPPGMLRHGIFTKMDLPERKFVCFLIN